MTIYFLTQFPWSLPNTHYPFHINWDTSLNIEIHTPKPVTLHRGEYHCIAYCLLLSALLLYLYSFPMLQRWLYPLYSSMQHRNAYPLKSTLMIVYSSVDVVSVDTLSISETWSVSHKFQSMMNRNIGVPAHYVLSQQRNLVISVLLVWAICAPVNQMTASFRPWWVLSQLPLRENFSYRICYGKQDLREILSAYLEKGGVENRTVLWTMNSILMCNLPFETL